MIYKAVFFDLDDTLVDALECHLMADKHVFEKHGLSYLDAVEKTKHLNFFGVRLADSLKIRRDAVGVSEKDLPIQTLMNDRNEYFLSIVPIKAKLLPGAYDALSYCYAQKSLTGIVSSGTRKYIQLCIDMFHLQRFISFIVCSEDVELGKPNPECYEKAYEISRLKNPIKKEECIVVEDSNNGIVAAKKAGLAVCFVPSHDAYTDEKPEYTLHTLEEFRKIPIGT